MVTGDVLFVWGDDILSDVIEWVTDGPAHVALLIDENTISEAQGGRPIGERPLSFYTDSADRLEIWRDVTLTDAEQTEMIRYARTLYGSPYDYALIPLELLHYEIGVDIEWYHEKKSRLCSTYVSDVAAHIGHQWAKTANPAPADVIKGGKLTKIYEWSREGRGWVTSKESTASA